MGARKPLFVAIAILLHLPFLLSYPCDEKPVNNYKCPTCFGYFSHPKNQSKFIECSWGRPFEMECDCPLIFNPEIQVCDWPPYLSRQCGGSGGETENQDLEGEAKNNNEIMNFIGADDGENPLKNIDTLIAKLKEANDLLIKSRNLVSDCKFETEEKHEENTTEVSEETINDVYGEDGHSRMSDNKEELEAPVLNNCTFNNNKTEIELQTGLTGSNVKARFDTQVYNEQCNNAGPNLNNSEQIGNSSTETGDEIFKNCTEQEATGQYSETEENNSCLNLNSVNISNETINKIDLQQTLTPENITESEYNKDHFETGVLSSKNKIDESFTENDNTNIPNKLIDQVQGYILNKKYNMRIDNEINEQEQAKNSNFYPDLDNYFINNSPFDRNEIESQITEIKSDNNLNQLVNQNTGNHWPGVSDFDSSFYSNLQHTKPITFSLYAPLKVEFPVYPYDEPSGASESYLEGRSRDVRVDDRYSEGEDGRSRHRLRSSRRKVDKSCNNQFDQFPAPQFEDISQLNRERMELSRENAKFEKEYKKTRKSLRKKFAKPCNCCY